MVISSGHLPGPGGGGRGGMGGQRDDEGGLKEMTYQKRPKAEVGCNNHRGIVESESLFNLHKR